MFTASIPPQIGAVFLGLSRAKYPSTMYVTIGHVTDKATLSSLYIDRIAAHNPALSHYIEHVKSEQPGMQKVGLLVK